ncbi:MAG: tRNA (guanosine(37)-N1)-methyltransferase TrmD [Bdellovibrionaceae bacterium]|nr:tRNA (guanosine(37)-N1)-methyltransferase TrmD [Pseudobdellovibrionaceae bacterium]
MPTFHFITLFPETISVWFSTSIPGKAARNGVFSVKTVQLRDFGKGPHRQVDDSVYGGGSGMVLSVEPLVKATEHTLSGLDRARTRVVAFTPGGKTLSRKLLDKLHSQSIEHFVLICGHYEGIDQRFLDEWVDEEISLGEFVLTGGELPAVAFADAYVRQLDGTLRDKEAFESESFQLVDPESGEPLLEYPHYTRPSEFQGRKVPEVLLSGNHGAIREWRLKQSRERTRTKQRQAESPEVNDA